MIDLEKKLDKIEAARVGVLETFMEHRMTAEEGLTCLSGLMIQVYYDTVTDKSKEKFIDIMGQCFDAYLETKQEEMMQ